MKVDESNYELLKRVSDITRTDYGIIWKDAENIEGYIDTDGLLSMIEELILEVDRLKEEIEDMNQPNDFDPEIEIPQIHGKGISW